MIQFPDADIHKWVEGYEFSSLTNKMQTISAVKIPRKARFLLSTEAAIA